MYMEHRVLSGSIGILAFLYSLLLAIAKAQKWGGVQANIIKNNIKEFGSI